MQKKAFLLKLADLRHTVIHFCWIFLGAYLSNLKLL